MKKSMSAIVAFFLIILLVGCRNIYSVAESTQKQNQDTESDFITSSQMNDVWGDSSEDEARAILYAPFDATWDSGDLRNKATLARQYIVNYIGKYGCTPEELNDMSRAFWYRVKEGLQYAYQDFGAAANNVFPEGITQRRALMQAISGGITYYLPTLGLFGEVVCYEYETDRESLCFEYIFSPDGNYNSETSYLEFLWITPGKVLYSNAKVDTVIEYAHKNMRHYTSLTDEECIKVIELFFYRDATNESWKSILSGYLQRHPVIAQ